MSSQRGNVGRTRPQRHQNSHVFKNDKYGVSPQCKKINGKLHDGVCQHCKEVLEWRVKFSKYKPLSKPKKCVKCLQKTVKDSYHIICRPCASELELCAKCGKREEIVIGELEEEDDQDLDGVLGDIEEEEDLDLVVGKN
uniref:Chromosome 9 open reading frame 85 n=1 Tax=Sphenodon punctatus TaxID=8508 RepID=A0A8D0HFZ1_SPHPU